MLAACERQLLTVLATDRAVREQAEHKIPNERSGDGSDS